MSMKLVKGDVITYKVKSIGNKIENIVVDSLNDEAAGGRTIYFEDGTSRLIRDIKILMLNGEEVVAFSDIRDGMIIKDLAGKNWIVSLKLYGHFTAIGKNALEQVSWVQKEFDDAMFRKVED